MRSTEPGRLLKLWDKLSNKEYRQSYAESFLFAHIANQIVRLRKNRGMRQEDLAIAASKRQSQISKLENPDNGEATLKSLLKIASAFDVALSVKFVSFSSLARDVVSSSEKLRIPQAFVVESSELRTAHLLDVTNDDVSNRHIRLFVSERRSDVVSDTKYVFDTSELVSMKVKRVADSTNSIRIKQTMHA